MARYVPDVTTNRWVIISTVRTKRPDLTKPVPDKICPFCEGNENLTPPETYRVGGGEANKPGWKIRVFANKYPITDIHEVIVHSTDDKKDIYELEDSHVIEIFKTYRNRINVNKEHGNVLVFCNHGISAGASLTHPHSQLVVVPHQIKFDILHRETLNNILIDNNHFVAYCPEFSQWPYEVWIAPKETNYLFCDIDDEKINDLALLTKRIVSGLCKKFKDLNYNYYIHHGRDWYLRIIPRTIHRAGFELGTGLSVNIADPALAAKELQQEL
ncbi:MAG TPA: DUF4931 domain-containing protein [Patescibacteria group bacterium]